MASEKITSLQVAARAGVSQSAVSRAFTPGASVSKKTIEKVKKAAAELEYRPNVLARAMVSGKSRIIGLVVAYLNNQFYPDALEKLSTVLQERGYHVLIFMASNSEKSIDNVIDEILDYQVDGIIAASVSLSSDLADRCRSAGVPAVLFNRSLGDAKMSSVTSDNLSGGRKVADYLLKTGHKRIAFIAGWDGASTQRDRERSFTDRLKEDGMSLHARGVGNFNSDQASDAVRKMFDCDVSDRPDAIFVANDHMAFAVMDPLRFELGLSIPDDVSVIGYDDVPVAAWQAYNLTTVRQPANRMVTETVDLLLAAIEHPESDVRQIEIDGPLVIRGSARVIEGMNHG
jgi:DNA-binding LacI/PurR family transcriptional regulator